MALFVKSGNPSALLQSIYKAIDDKKIVTWEYDQDKDFTHVPDQWRKKAWFRPSTESGLLRFGLYGVKGVKMSKAIYGIYHGRFIEEILTHFDTDISDVRATARKDPIDNFD